jgi:hypothetical protein
VGGHATEVVGLYGDPDSTWGIALDLGLEVPADADLVGRRAELLAADHPHLGPAPVLQVVDEAARSAAVHDAAAAAYPPGGPMVRLVLSADGRSLLVAAHHGAVDGLGLLGVAREVLDLDLRSAARGIGRRPAPVGFVRSSVRRLGEALVSPPVRFRGAGEEGSAREDLTAHAVPAQRRGTSALAAAVLATHGRLHPEARGRAVLAVGASRRSDPRPTPDRQTAYLRLRAATDLPPVDVAALLADLPPEPDFPETSAGGVGPLITRAVRSRLGATATLSNLGQLEGALTSAAMYPALNGPRAVGVGLATAGETTTLTLRTRRRDFTADEHGLLVAALAEALLA